jgi:hypothetical protein
MSYDASESVGYNPHPLLHERSDGEEIRHIVNLLETLDPDAEPGVLEGFDHCIIGVGEVEGQPPRVIYDVIAILITLQERDGLSEPEATIYFETNIKPAIPSKEAPVFATRPTELLMSQLRFTSEGEAG